MGIVARQNYDPSRENEDQLTGLKCPLDEEPGAVQAEKDACDVNKIMAKYIRADILNYTRRIQAAYGDFSNVESYQKALQDVQEAQDAFMELPAHLRAKFENDPAQLMTFLQDPRNLDEAVKLGLVNPPAQVAPPAPAPQTAAAPAPSPAKT